MTILYILSFVMAFLISFLTTPLAKKIAFKVGAIDKPKDRGVHTKPMPRMGGIAIVLGFMITLLVITPFVPLLNWKQFFGVSAGATIIFVLGFFDDVHDLNAKLKLVFQIIAALLVTSSGIKIQFVSWPFFENTLLSLQPFATPITVIWIVGVTNAVNLIDGLDGLAAGVSSIASICLMALSIHSGHPLAVLLTATLAGSCLGFLPYNFSPATIFMGDTGSTFLGFILAVTSILGLLKSYTFATIFIAVLVLGLPIFDTTFAIVRRYINGKPIMEADRGHLHHRLMDKGYSQKQAVVTLYGVSGGFGLAAITLFTQDYRFVIGIFLIMALLFYMNVIRYSHDTTKHDK